MQLSKVLQERVDEFVNELRQPSGGRFGKKVISIQGDVGLGKTSLLLDLRGRLADIGLCPVFVSPPSRAVDTGPAVITQVADAFHGYQLINGEMESLVDPRIHLSKKLDLLGKVVSDNRGSVVFLCDEPREWVKAESEDSDDFYVQDRKETIVNQISQWDCRFVITGRPPASIPYSKVSQQKLPFDCVRIQEQPCGSLQDVAEELVHRLGPNLAVSTALARRLLMAFAKATSVDAAVELYGGWPYAWDIARKLAEAVSNIQQLAPVRDAWAKLALFRGQMSFEILKLLGIDKLNEGHRAIVIDGLLQQSNDLFSMHGILKQPKEVSHWQEPLRRSTHELFAGYFKTKLVPSTSPEHRSEDALEGFHHAVLADNSDPRDVFPVQSIEQLHVLGRFLSKHRQDHVGAAEVFKEVVKLDDFDDYGHHYWAYNVDWMAANEALAEREYKRALELNREHPWWWSRWINFLITTGNLAQARREWNKASVELNVRECGSTDRVWRALHLWVARLLLHRGQIEFARYVLGDVPEELRNYDPQFVALGKLLRFLDQVDDEESVFPWSVSPNQWWTKPYPNLVFDLEVDKRPLKRWHPGRVLTVDDRAVWLVVGKAPESAEASPTFGVVPMDRPRFDAACNDASAAEIEPDRYLELAFYGDDDVIRIRCHPSSVQMDSDLPGFDPPDPRRYLKRGHA